MALYSLYNPKWLNGNYYPNIVSYYYKEWNNFYMSPHTHDQVEIMYIISGSCVAETLGVPLTLNKGDFILVDAGIPHGLEIAKDMRCRMLNIEFNFVEMPAPAPSIQYLAEEMPLFSTWLKARQQYMIAQDSYGLFPVMKNMIMELDEKREGHQLLISLYMSDILIKLSRAYADYKGHLSNSGSLHVRKAIQYLHENYDQDIRIPNIASNLGIHEGHLYRVFKEQTGKTPIEYLTDLRLNKAAMLLRMTEIPISQICDYVGFNSSQYFTSLFKKYMGRTPTKYRSTVERCVEESDSISES